MQKEGKKNDKKDDKTRWELMPLDCLEDIARVYTEGARKYGENTWQNLENGYQRYKAALLRHLWEFEKGNEIDPETGCHHLAQVCWNSIALLYLSKHSMKDMTVEIWRTAYNFPDYEVSNFGKVRSKDRIIEHSNGRLHKTIGKILVQRLDHNGYLTVSLQKNKRNYKVKVHRMVLGMQEFKKGMNTEEKLDKILLNQQVILLYLRQILQDTNRSQFLEDYAANLAAQATEIILGHNIVRK